MKNYIADMLAPLIDDEHLTLAIKLDEHLRKKWEDAGEDFKKVLESFDAHHPPIRRLNLQYTLY